MPDSLTVVAVGDLQLGDSPTTVGYGFYSQYHGTDIEPLFADVQAALRPADILFANLETTLMAPSAAESGRGALQLRGEPAFAAALRRVGFNVLNVANNHANQHGDESFHATVAALRSAGIACCGVRGTGEWASEPARLLNGRAGLLGYCLRPRQYASITPPYAEGTREQICADVRRLRATGAIVIVSLHWGEEFVTEPSHDEVALGHAVIDAGATLILGHHPHVVRHAERYAHGVIAHSLGNFMGDMTWYAPFRRGAILSCRVRPNGTESAVVTATRLRDDYRPELTGAAPVDPVSSGQLAGLDDAEYARAIAQSWRAQRLAAYRAAIANLRRTPFRIAAQMFAETVRNKFIALRERIFGRA